MNKEKFKIVSVLGVSFLLFVFFTLPVLFADAPLRPPTPITLFSLNKKYAAYLDSVKRETTVYAAQKGKENPLWKMSGWFRYASLSNDGEILAVGYDGLNLLTPDYTKSTVMIQFFKKGALVKSVTLAELIQDFSKLRQTVSHYHWGTYLGFDNEGNFWVETVEGRKQISPLPEK